MSEVPLSTQGPSWGYLKVNFSVTLSIFVDKCPQNGSKNEPGMPPRRASRGNASTTARRKLASAWAAMSGPGLEGESLLNL